MLAVSEQWAAMFFVLGVAVLIDGLDGPLARLFRVAQVLPRWSGDTLDLVVDFTTYVFVPAYAIAASGFVPQALAVMLGVVIVVSGALYFADRDMKTSDNYFRGFPAVWSVIAFYLFILAPPSWLGAVMVIAFAILTFVPVTFVHPLRVRAFRPLTIAVMIVWALLALVAVLQNLEPSVWVRVGLSLAALYFIGVGLVKKQA
jgi:phosphatidylcholine synthase